MVNLAVVGSFVFFILCLVADFHEISNRFFKFLWDGSEMSWIVFLNKFQIDRIRRDQRAVCLAARAVRRPCPPLDDARSASQTARSSRACMVQDRRSGGLPSAARRRALRSGFVPLNAPLRLPLHLPRSPTADRSQGFIAEAGVPPGAIPLVAPTIPVCGQLPPPVRIPWATRFGIPARAFCIPSLPSRSAPVRRSCRCRESNLI